MLCAGCCLWVLLESVGACCQSSPCLDARSNHRLCETLVRLDRGLPSSKVCKALADCCSRLQHCCQAAQLAGQSGILLCIMESAAKHLAADSIWQPA